MFSSTDTLFSSSKTKNLYQVTFGIIQRKPLYSLPISWHLPERLPWCSFHHTRIGRAHGHYHFAESKFCWADSPELGTPFKFDLLLHRTCAYQRSFDGPILVRSILLPWYRRSCSFWFHTFWSMPKIDLVCLHVHKFSLHWYMPLIWIYQRAVSVLFTSLQPYLYIRAALRFFVGRFILT